MNHYDFFNALQQHNENPTSKLYDEFFKAILRKKWILIFSLVICLSAAYVYNNLTVPAYEAAVLLKKDNPENNSFGKNLTDIFTLQNTDLIETEMKLVKTTAVMKNTVSQLKMNLIVEKIVNPGGSIIEINKTFPEYDDKYMSSQADANTFPQLLDINIPNDNASARYVIKKISENSSAIYDPVSWSLYGTTFDSTLINISLPQLSLSIFWPSVKVGAELYLSVSRCKSLAIQLMNQVNVEQVENTDIIQISVRAGSPYLAKELANAIAKAYQETRIEQQKESIRYSFHFIDQQLQEVAIKLKNAEIDLSSFKSKNQIITIGEKSSSLIEYLSTLEAEKIKTDIELTEYAIKKGEIEKEYGEKGIFDQTYLTPDKTSNSVSPFANLQAQYSRLELERIELLKKHTKNHPDVINIDNQIDQVKKEMSKYNQNTLSAYQVLINAATKKKTELDKFSKTYQSMIGNIPPQESILSELMRERAVYDKVFTLLLNKREEMRIAELSKLQDLMVIEPAMQSDRAVSPKKSLNIILSLFIGLFIGVLIIWFLEKYNKKLDDLDIIEDQFKLPILGIIPSYPRRFLRQVNRIEEYSERFIILMNNIDKFKEAFNYLKIKINYKIKETPKVMIFTSCEEHTGKTSLVAHLAIYLAKQNKRVLVIDGDFKRARLSELFDLPPGKPGFYNYLSNGDNLPPIYNVIKYKDKDKYYKTLDVIPVGEITKNSSTLLETDKMLQFVALIQKSTYDYVIFDTPPAIRVVDALIIGSLIKNTILVVRPDRTYMDSVTWGIKEMELHGMNIMGTVVNACNIGRSAFRHRYGYGYEYSYSSAGSHNKDLNSRDLPKELPQ